MGGFSDRIARLANSPTADEPIRGVIARFHRPYVRRADTCNARKDARLDAPARDT